MEEARRAEVGGWRDIRTGLVYWNASTQTGNTGGRRNDRITQTVQRADKWTNVGRDKAVQVDSMPDPAEISVRPGRWVPDPEHSAPDKKILESVLKIQRFYRSWRRRTALTRFQEVSVDRKKEEADQETIPGPDTYRSTDFVILNRSTPRTRRDFELLYNLLDRWRILETERAGCSFLEPSRTALGGLILSKEVELLRAIDSMKTVAKLTRRERNYRKFLDRLSKPVLWRNRRTGQPILVDTLRVQQARGLRDFYLVLCDNRLSASKRVDVLNQLRDLVWEHTCGNSFQVIYLVDQELDLLSRGVQEAKLNWLRNRLKLAFLKLARDSLGTVAEEEEEEPVPRKLCRNCGKLLPVARFSHGSDISLGCNQCVYLRPGTGPRIVLEPYARMLRELRRSEARMGAYDSPAFIIDTELVYHLVNDIWHARSAITEIDNFDGLRLIRFHNRVEWSPWNSLLVTEKEASVHRSLPDPEQFYGQFLLQKFRAKNLQAKIRFGPVLRLS